MESSYSAKVLSTLTLRLITTALYQCILYHNSRGSKKNIYVVQAPTFKAGVMVHPLRISTFRQAVVVHAFNASTQKAEQGGPL